MDPDEFLWHEYHRRRRERRERRIFNRVAWVLLVLLFGVMALSMAGSHWP